MGANIGQFSSEIVRLFDGVCHAVEPDFELLAIIPDHPRIRTYGYAIATQQAPVVLHRGSSRLAASIVDSPGSSVPGDSGVLVNGIDLNSFVLQHVAGPISLIKMDIEGAEVKVLDSLSDEFLTSIPQISVEFHDFNDCTPPGVVRRLAERLQALGFYYLRMSGVGHQDTLFINRRHAAFDWSDYLTTRFLVRNVRGFRRIVRRRLGLQIRCC